jgi:hypothetical protein
VFIKKLIIFFIIAIFAAGTAFADRPDSFGIGAIVTFEGVSDTFGVAMGYGITLKTPVVPIFIGAKFFFNYTNYTVMTFTADYYIFDKSLVESIKLDWYAGLGIDFQYYNNSNNNYFYGIGVRIPIGLTFYPIDKIGIFLEVSPTPYYKFTPSNDEFRFYTSVGIGARYYF